MRSALSGKHTIPLIQSECHYGYAESRLGQRYQHGLDGKMVKI